MQLLDQSGPYNFSTGLQNASKNTNRPISFLIQISSPIHFHTNHQAHFIVFIANYTDIWVSMSRQIKCMYSSLKDLNSIKKVFISKWPASVQSTLPPLAASQAHLRQTCTFCILLGTTVVVHQTKAWLNQRSFTLKHQIIRAKSFRVHRHRSVNRILDIKIIYRIVQLNNNYRLGSNLNIRKIRIYSISNN